MLFFLVSGTATCPRSKASFRPRRIREAPRLPPDPAREARIEGRRRELARQARRLGVRL